MDRRAFLINAGLVSAWAGDAVTLILTQGDGHTHLVALSAVQVGEIGTGKKVTATSSSDDGHTHPVTFN